MVWDELLGVWVYSTPVGIAELAAYLGTDVDDEDYLRSAPEDLLAAVYVAVQNALNSCASTRPVPDALYKYVVLEVAGEFYKRKDQGTAQQAGFENVVAVRAPKDPLTTVYPLIRPYIGGGFA